MEKKTSDVYCGPKGQWTLMASCGFPVKCLWALFQRTLTLPYKTIPILSVICPPQGIHINQWFINRSVNFQLLLPPHWLTTVGDNTLTQIQPLSRSVTKGRAFPLQQDCWRGEIYHFILTSTCGFTAVWFQVPCFHNPKKQDGLTWVNECKGKQKWWLFRLHVQLCHYSVLTTAA